MKFFSTPFQLLAGLSLVASSAPALTLTTATTTENFDGYNTAGAAPGVSDWSTTSFTAAQTTGPFAANSGTITDDATFNTQVALLAASDMVTALASVVANGTNSKGKIVTASNVGPFTSPHLATQATTLSFTGLLGNLVVGGINPLTGMNVVWDSGIDLAASLTTAGSDSAYLNGHRLYYSVGGAVGSFKPVANYLWASGTATNTTTLNNTANIVFDSVVLPGTSVYVLWGDDNAATNNDGSFAIDNVRFTGVAVPEPALLSTVLLLGGFSALRRRR